MEKFNFSYKDSIKKIHCIYTDNDTVTTNNCWEGYILVKNIDGILNIEGYEIDKADSIEKNGNPHLRYILGNNAISYTNKSLIFEIYPGNIAPIHYEMLYNSEDKCFYGNWELITSNNHPYPKNREGKAIIYIEDEMNLEENNIYNIVRNTAIRANHDYSKEIKTFKTLSEIQFYQELLKYKRNHHHTIRKLSKYSNVLKEKYHYN